jgi:hypothetical protein
MPTKKGKSKPAKARKASNKIRRTRAASGGPNRSKRASSKRTGTGLRRTEAGPVWIGSSPAPISPPAGQPGDTKAGTGGSDRVVIL